jgi:hypothetical protein
LAEAQIPGEYRIFNPLDLSGFCAGVHTPRERIQLSDSVDRAIQQKESSRQYYAVEVIGKRISRIRATSQ